MFDNVQRENISRLRHYHRYKLIQPDCSFFIYVYYGQLSPFHVQTSVKVLVGTISRFVKNRQTWLTCLPGLAPVHGAQLDLVVGVHLQKQALRHVVVETWGTIEIIMYVQTSNQEEYRNQ